MFNLFLIPTFCDSELGENSRLACESQWEHFTLQTDSIVRPMNRMNELKQNIIINIIPVSSLPAIKDNPPLTYDVTYTVELPPGPFPAAPSVV